MSKTVKGSYINLTDDLEAIKNKIAKVPTDDGKGKIKPFQGGPLTFEKTYRYESAHGTEAKGVMALMHLVEIFQGEKKRKEYERQYTTSGVKYRELKEELAKAIYKELEPIQRKRAVLEKDPSYVERVLKVGAKRAQKVAEKTLKETKIAMGLGSE